MAKGPLSKVEKFYIEGHLEQSDVEIAKELGRTKAAVSKYRLTLNPADVVTPVEPTPVSVPVDRPPELPKLKDLFLNKTAVHNRRGVVAATPASATLSDELKKFHKSVPNNPAITKIHND